MITNTYTKRPLGARAPGTRNALLDALTELLADEPLRLVEITAVARIARTSPASFYQYFTSLDDAVLALAERLADDAAVAFATPPATPGPPAVVAAVHAFHTGHAGALSAVLSASLDHAPRPLAVALDAVLDPMADALARALSLSRPPVGDRRALLRSALLGFLVALSRGRFLPVDRAASEAGCATGVLVEILNLLSRIAR